MQAGPRLPSKPSAYIKRKEAFYSATWLCEALVDLWRVVCLDPELRDRSGIEKRGQLAQRLINWHKTALRTAEKGFEKMVSLNVILLQGYDRSESRQINAKPFFMDMKKKRFIGFKPAIEACRWVKGLKGFFLGGPCLIIPVLSFL